MLGNSHFYHKSIRKLVSSFGSIFNDIDIYRYDNDSVKQDRIKVPLIYAPKEKYVQRKFSDPELLKSILTTLPRMSFELMSFNYDPSRKSITTLKNYNRVDNKEFSQYNCIPYNFNFSLNIKTRTIEDGTQILEQILPFFTPDYTLSIDFIPEMTQTYDVPIILNSSSSEGIYVGDFSDIRILEWDLGFTAKSYLFPPIKSSGIIRKVINNISTSNTVNPPLEDIVTTAVPYDADPSSDYGISQIITIYDE